MSLLCVLLNVDHHTIFGFRELILYIGKVSHSYTVFFFFFFPELKKDQVLMTNLKKRFKFMQGMTTLKKLSPGKGGEATRW